MGRHVGAFGGGRSITAPSAFAADDGTPETNVRNAIDLSALVEALRLGRVLVAVVAIAEEVDGHGTEKSSNMAVVSMVAQDGRRGLLAFSGVDALNAWDPSARPVPVSGIDAARAAIDDDCEALVLDVAGPRTQVLPEGALIALAGLDPLAHAHALVDRSMVKAFGPERVAANVQGDRLHLQVTDDALDANDVAAAISPRVLALVPAGIEISTGSVE